MIGLLASYHCADLVTLEKTGQRNAIHKALNFLAQLVPQGMRQTTLTVLAVFIATTLGDIETLTDGINVPSFTFVMPISSPW